MKALAYLFFATILFTSCKTRTSNHSDQGISIDSSQKVFMNIVVAKPVFVCSFKDSTNRDFIVGINEFENPELNSLRNYILTRIVSVNNNWQIEKEDTIDNKGQVNILDSFKVENINNQNLISFTAFHYPGGNVDFDNSIEFHLIDLITFHDYSIICDGEDVSDSGAPVVSGDFSYDDLLNKNPELKKFQEIKSQQSKYIYKKTAADYDINNVGNCYKKWLIDNPGIEEREYANDEPIHLTYYDKGLIGEDVNLNKDTTEDGTEIFQNANYKIIYIWRNGVYAYDKILKKEFPVWFHNSSRYGDFDVELQSKDIVSIASDDFNYYVTVDLDKKTYSRRPINTKMNYNIDQNDSASPMYELQYKSK